MNLGKPVPRVAIQAFISEVVPELAEFLCVKVMLALCVERYNGVECVSTAQPTSLFFYDRN